eukprot:TRINITY_DN4354_c0_g2_i1.p1 TRINITY_DN4354_c0_g2~~TRINITY_DN4354_c0_g2_i1.p1  ORF type:complete len:141 (+),score=37.30 TRINITY_DN4354_c0_g2_i1:104-526(+)
MKFIQALMFSTAYTVVVALPTVQHKVWQVESTAIDKMTQEHSATDLSNPVIRSPMLLPPSPLMMRRREKRGVYNLIPTRPRTKSEEMLMATLMDFETARAAADDKDNHSSSSSSREHRRKTRTRRKLMKLLRNLLQEESS